MNITMGEYERSERRAGYLKAVFWGLCVAAVVAIFCWCVISGDARGKLQTQRAIDSCKAMGGETLYTWYPNSDEFELTGCKVPAR